MRDVTGSDSSNPDPSRTISAISEKPSTRGRISVIAAREPHLVERCYWVRLVQPRPVPNNFCDHGKTVHARSSFRDRRKLPWFFGWTIVSANRKFRHGQCARAGWSVTRQGRASPVSVRPNEVGLDVNACLKQAERRSPPFSVPHLQQGWIANLDGLICQARIFNPATVCPKS